MWVETGVCAKTAGRPRDTANNPTRRYLEQSMTEYPGLPGIILLSVRGIVESPNSPDLSRRGFDPIRIAIGVCVETLWNKQFYIGTGPGGIGIIHVMNRLIHIVDFIVALCIT